MTSLEMQIDQLTIEDQTNETNEINELKVKYIRHNRAKPRFNGFLKNKDNLDDWDDFCYENNCIGSLAFDVIWEDNSESREPLQSFITYNSISNEYYINDKILEIIKDYILTAKQFPKCRRNCLMCNERVFNGNYLCSNHIYLKKKVFD